MLKKILFIGFFLIIQQIGCIRTSGAPVLLWGVESPTRATLPRIKKADFTELLRPLLKDHALVAFIEPDLTTKDFVCQNPTTKTSCYSFLQRQKPRTFFANVEKPLGALEALGGRKISTLTEQPASCEVGQVTMVNLGEGDGERWQQLEAHDAAIASTISRLNCSVVYLYLPVPSQLLRLPRRAINANNLFITATFSMYVEKIVVKTAQVDDPTKVQAEVLKATAMTPTPKDNDISVVLALDNSNEITFLVKKGGGYYTVDEFVYNGMNFRASEVLTPATLSYFCGELRLVNKTTTLIWHSLQFQGATTGLGKNLAATFKFYDAWHCVGFVTPAIIAGIFVMVLIASITLMGVCWIMDINTNDRFDDPKGNTISVTLEE